MTNQLNSFGLDDNVAQTLLIPLYMKSLQSKKKNSFFTDNLACELVEKLHLEFSDFHSAKKSLLGCTLRANYFDQKVIEFVSHNPNPVIVNLGCGLDGRYQRLGFKLDKEVPFYHLDLPEVISFRERLIPASSNDKSISASLFDSEWMDNLHQAHPKARFLFLIEGVLMYFEKQAVKEFLIQLSTRFSQSELVFDATSQWMCDHSNKHDTVKHSGAKFKLALNDSQEIESWAPQLKVLSNQYYSDFKEWKQVGMTINLMMKLNKNIRQASYIVHACIK